MRVTIRLSVIILRWQAELQAGISWVSLSWTLRHETAGTASGWAQVLHVTPRTKIGAKKRIRYRANSLLMRAISTTKRRCSSCSGSKGSTKQHFLCRRWRFITKSVHVAANLTWSELQFAVLSDYTSAATPNIPSSRAPKTTTRSLHPLSPCVTYCIGTPSHMVTDGWQSPPIYSALLRILVTTHS